jgi:type I restriction enzyme S subunit
MNNLSVDGKLLLDDVVEVSGDATDAARYALQPGDVLVNNRNSAELVGKTAVVTTTATGWTFNNNLLRLRFDRDVVMPAFAAIQMNAPRFREQVATVVSATTNVAALYTRDLKRLQLCVPPLERQAALVLEYEEFHERLGRMSGAVDSALTRTASLRRSLLAAAFLGRLTHRATRQEGTDV